MPIRLPYRSLPIDQAGVTYEHGPDSVRREHVPPMVGVFVEPGVFPDIDDLQRRKNRNAEYDAFDDRYATFLLEEVLPRVDAIAPTIDDPGARALCGGSSGGNCGITAAWHRPDAFHKVIALVSSFAQIPGGNPYPELLATTPRKPLRIFLQENHHDLGWNEPEDNWLAENLRTAAGFAEAGYDFRFALGEGEHTGNLGGVLLPDALRWLWRDYPTRSGSHPGADDENTSRSS